MSIRTAAEDASFQGNNTGPRGNHGGRGMVGNQVVSPPIHLHNDHTIFPRPRRLRWTIELHDMFVSAVNELGGPSHATPRNILDLMGLDVVTKYQIKSHLQKYRKGKTARWLTRNAAPADGPINEEGELAEYEPDAIEMDGDETLKAQNNGNLDPPVESQSSVTAENPPALSTDFPEWSGLVDEDFLKPIVPHLNSLGYPSELPFLRTNNSSSSTVTFGNFFEDVERFPRIDDDPMMIDDVYPYFGN